MIRKLRFKNIVFIVMCCHISFELVFMIFMIFLLANILKRKKLIQKSFYSFACACVKFISSSRQNFEKMFKRPCHSFRRHLDE